LNYRSLVLVAFFLLQAVAATAQTSDMPWAGHDSRTVRIQAKVESIYEQGDFARAHFLYVNELAPIGDKYAQYMAGYMYLKGQGVPQDPVQALAWYRLAAENGAAEFVAVRNQLMAQLSEEDLERSDATYVKLRQRYGDLAVVMSDLRRGDAVRNVEITGSRIKGGAKPLTIVDPRTGSVISGDEYFRRANSRSQEQLDYIADTLGIEPMFVDNLTEADLDALERQVEDYLSIIDDR